MASLSRLVALCVFAGALSAVAGADEEKVPLDKVPPAVTKAVRAKFPGATIKQAEKEVDDGKTIYEIGLEHAGSKIDVSLKEDGTIVSIEKEIAAADLPKPVRDAIKGKYPAGTIKKAEDVTENGKRVFEVILNVGDKQREVVLDPSGKIVEDEDAGED